MSKRLRRYVRTVTAAGALGLVLVHFVGRGWDLTDHGVVFGALLALIVLGDLTPLWTARRDRDGLVPVSPVFALAMLLSCGVAPAAVSAAVASLLTGVVRRQPTTAVAFAMAQRVVSVLAAAVALWLVGSAQFGAAVRIDWNTVVPVVLACAAFIVVSLLVTSLATAFTARDNYGPQAARPLQVWLRRELTGRGRYAGLLLSLAPIVALATERHVLLLGLFALPAVAVSRSIAITAGRDHQVLHDDLTGLPNRQLLADRLNQAIALARRHGDKTGVLVLDVTGFGEVNDSLGRACGDVLLQQIAGQLVRTLRGVDTVARIGADEFAVVLHGVRNRDDVEVVADNLRRALATPTVIAGVPLAVELSVGAALWPDHGGSADTVLRCAESAMQRAKRQRGGYRLYASSSRGGVNRMQLLARLRDGLQRDELEVHFQPQASLATGELVGAEALVRWRREGRLVPPNEFIPIAEHSDLIHQLTRYVLHRAVRQAGVWRDTGLPLRVAVNLSARDLQDTGLPAMVAELLESSQLDPMWLELEISEHSLMSDVERARTMLAQFRSMGISLAIDDFGTGTTSLAHLPHLPIDVLKIDRSFVANLERHADDLIVRTTIDLARSLGLRVVAEGVETQQVWQRLAHLGCQMAQGYYLCRPIPAEQLTSWLDMIGRRAAPYQAGLWQRGSTQEIVLPT
ncbi:MAG: bifunctional diguanylate cyclase/phosphodiesterase [Actinobacteria bacterium]|nr:bifunctional diguanylate cyclase/phosphodiesterase [Actinomycetota bacterium]